MLPVLTECLKKVDALSVNRKFPIIIRNIAKESACRIGFDLAYECGHLIMHDGIETGCKQTERERRTLLLVLFCFLVRLSLESFLFV